MEIALFPKFVWPAMDPVRRHHLNCCLSTLLVVLTLPLIRFVPHVCVMQWIFHIPCPGCGVTTSLRAMTGLNFGRAWAANPAAFAVVIGFMFQIIGRPLGLLLCQEHGLLLLNRISLGLSYMACFLLCVVWVFKIV